MALVDDAGYRSDSNLRYVPLPLRQMWEDLARQFPQKLSTAARDTLAQLFAALVNLVKPFKAAGVKMLAGSDSGGAAAWCIPGPGLHQEFDELEKAGLSPLDVLQMTTLNVAAFLGRGVAAWAQRRRRQRRQPRTAVGEPDCERSEPAPDRGRRARRNVLLRERPRNAQTKNGTPCRRRNSLDDRRWPTLLLRPSPSSRAGAPVGRGSRGCETTEVISPGQLHRVTSRRTLLQERSGVELPWLKGRKYLASLDYAAQPAASLGMTPLLMMISPSAHMILDARMQSIILSRAPRSVILSGSARWARTSRDARQSKRFAWATPPRY